MTNENPFFSAYETPYEVPDFDKIQPEHFLPAFKEGMKQQMQMNQQQQLNISMVM